MKQYKQAFDSFIGVKPEPNQHELVLLQKGQKYISKLSKIPGVEMIAIVNSLSMHATHTDSDIDLFIITKPGMIWFVRFWSTLILWAHGVWRRDADIAGNLCLSFFVTTEAMDLSNIAIEDDIYLYYWIYYMRPIVDKNETYEEFLAANNWVSVDEEQKEKNIKYLIFYSFKAVNSVEFSFFLPLWRILNICQRSFRDYFTCTRVGNSRKRDEYRYQKEPWKIWKVFVTFCQKVMGRTQKNKKKEYIYTKLNTLIRYFLLPRTLRTYDKLGRPEGVIISDQMLKFHDRDRRVEIRDSLM